VTPTPAALSVEVERVAAEYLRTRYSGPGNPMKTEMLVDGELLATKVSFAPGNAQMNGVHGLYRAELVRRVLDFYAQTQQPCWIDVTPATPPSVTDALCDAGFRPASVISALYAEPVPVPVPPRYDADIVEVAATGLDVFLDTINAGFGTPETMLAALRRNQSFWCDVTTWRLLLARIDGRPAAAAVLSIHDDTGYLAAAATLPEFRNRGLQSALIAARMAVARTHGCRRITGQAAAGSVSQCNQQRAGLGIVHTKTLWTNVHRTTDEAAP
jgi:GNAT superfamily N-acetyltransferase